MAQDAGHRIEVCVEDNVTAQAGCQRNGVQIEGRYRSLHATGLAACVRWLLSVPHSGGGTVLLSLLAQLRDSSQRRRFDAHRLLRMS